MYDGTKYDFNRFLFPLKFEKNHNYEITLDEARNNQLNNDSNSKIPKKVREE